MDEHLSEFALDELVLTADFKHPHLRMCGRCRSRLNERTLGHEVVKRTPEFHRTFARIQASRGARQRYSWRWRIGGLGAVATAMFLAMVIAEREPTTARADRIKGTARVAIVRGAYLAPKVTQGDRIALVVSPVGRRHALLMAVGEDGDVSQLWPVDEPISGPISGAASERLAPDFRITPGSFAVHAVFTDEPIRAQDVEIHLRRAIESGRARGQSPLQAKMDPISQSSHVASYVVRVRSEN